MVQRLKASFPMLVTLAGMTMLASLLQPLKVLAPMLIKPLLVGRVTLVRPLQSAKAELPMVVTVLGMTMLARMVQSLKALFPMLVTLAGMTMPESLLQPLKLSLSMLIKPLFVGRVTLARPLQP
jgi:hypothetical protein